MFLEFFRSLERVRCFLLTCVIVFTMLLSSVLSPNGTPSAVLTLFYYGVILMAPYFVSRNKRLFHITLIAGAVILVPKLFVLFSRPTGVFDYDANLYLLFEVITLLFEIMLVFCVMHYSIVTKGANEPVFGCILTYLLLGLVFGNIYYLIQIYMPGAFVSKDTLILTRNDLHYMSFTTLTTCGFGDIVPRLPLARSLTILEACCGTLYVALFIGRLIPHFTMRLTKFNSEI